mmetsp:Transcript_32276/g.55788  ORF Transcript_32276/g.55788 Transcript_32276/m.55788 type:complete len:259 (-) Transcript_32276:1417-2193(-)
MGDCASRPSRERVSLHMRDSKSRNDLKFFERPSVLALQAFPYAPMNLSERIEFYEVCLRRLSADEASLLKATERYGIKLKEPPYPYINVEVQKGVDIVSTELCLQNCQPFVTVSLEPNGTQQSTFPGDIEMPVWFALMEFHLGTFRYEKIVFTVFLKRRLGSPSEYGRVEFSLKEIKDQELREGWYELKLTQPVLEAKPRLKLRLQMISELNKVVETLKKTCEEALKKTKSLLVEFTEKLREAEEEHKKVVGALIAAV